MSWNEPTPGVGWQSSLPVNPVPTPKPITTQAAASPIPQPSTSSWGSSGQDAVASPVATIAEEVAPDLGATMAGPPMLWLAVAAVLAVAGIVLPLVFHGATVGTIGWLLAGPIAIVLLGVFQLRDATSRSTGWYAQSDLADWGRRLVVVLTVVAVALNAWEIANDVARGIWR